MYAPPEGDESVECWPGSHLLANASFSNCTSAPVELFVNSPAQSPVSNDILLFLISAVDRVPHSLSFPLLFTAS